MYIHIYIYIHIHIIGTATARRLLRASKTCTVGYFKLKPKRNKNMYGHSCCTVGVFLDTMQKETYPLVPFRVPLSSLQSSPYFPPEFPLGPLGPPRVLRRRAAFFASACIYIYIYIYMYSGCCWGRYSYRIGTVQL